MNTIAGNLVQNLVGDLVQMLVGKLSEYLDSSDLEYMDGPMFHVSTLSHLMIPVFSTSRAMLSPCCVGPRLAGS